MKRLITLILAIALCVPLYIPAQAEFQYDLSEHSLLLILRMYTLNITEEWKKLETLQSKIVAAKFQRKHCTECLRNHLSKKFYITRFFSNM